MLRLTLSNVDKKYGPHDVLKGFSTSFEGSGTYVLMGDNGAGKSTLLRICALIEEPDGGGVDYWSADARLAKDLRLRRRLTLVLPGIGVFNRSVFDNAAYGLKIRGVGEQELRRRVLDALEFVGLAQRAGQNALSLSSGETRRLGIARAMVIEPEALFLDEPTAFLDAKNKALIEDIVIGLRKNSRLIVIATHDREQAEKLGDKVLLLGEGRLVP